MHDTSTTQDRQRMQALVAFTAASLTTPFPSPFGAAVYDSTGGRLVAQAYDTVLQAGDPTNHAEINAIRLATRTRGTLSLRGCVLYSTCEPCPMCMSACIWAEVDGVVFGASTLEDANWYWPQVSDMTPQELIAHIILGAPCFLRRHVERALCQELFARCDAVRSAHNLGLPPHRGA